MEWFTLVQLSITSSLPLYPRRAALSACCIECCHYQLCDLDADRAQLRRGCLLAAKAQRAETAASNIDWGPVAALRWPVITNNDSPKRRVHAVPHKGSVKLKVLPWPTAESTQMRPWCRSTMERQIVSPRPVPGMSRSCRRVNGRNK